MSNASPPALSTTVADRLAERFRSVRSFSTKICEPLSPEDCAIQSMPDASPTRWHLAHTTWFFETFVLAGQTSYQPFDPQYGYLFNSYYNLVGKQFPRPHRGLLSRPSLEEIRDYRRHVDEQIVECLLSGEGPSDRIAATIEIGLHHEQQHQELMLTDIKHVLSFNPVFPVYREGAFAETDREPGGEWVDFDEGVYSIGHEGDEFAFDNESPRHRVFLETFQLASRLVTCGDFLQFIEEGGYKRPELWLSLGWQVVSEQKWRAPLYWHDNEGQWMQFTLAGLPSVDPAQPVTHISFFEADAFARWAGARLPTEAEWEVASLRVPIEGNFADRVLDSGAAVHPSRQVIGKPEISQMFGDVWEWTSSSYSPYPGYAPAAGALGEYNGKFMCNQYVLRGGSCATSRDHIRRTYRNFFPPEARWQFSGVRLCR